MKQTDMKEMLQYLKAIVVTQSRIYNKREGYQYRSVEHLILERGFAFTEIHQDPSVYTERNDSGYCYANCLHAMVAETGLIYCEGYVAGIIPVLHAWLITKDGTVIDPTWHQEKLSMAYYGIPFSYNYALKETLKAERYGLLDAHEQGWPLVKKFPKTALHPSYRKEVKK